jgi:N-hydroxyarylamine O-acetyltransferase
VDHPLVAPQLGLYADFAQGGRVSVSGRMVIETIRRWTRTEQRLDTDDALLAAYREHFGIELSRLPDDPAA